MITTTAPPSFVGICAGPATYVAPNKWMKQATSNASFGTPRTLLVCDHKHSGLQHTPGQPLASRCVFSTAPICPVALASFLPSPLPHTQGRKKNQCTFSITLSSVASIANALLEWYGIQTTDISERSTGLEYKYGLSWNQSQQENGAQAEDHSDAGSQREGRARGRAGLGSILGRNHILQHIHSLVVPVVLAPHFTPGVCSG